jgi:molecular chaperone DnaK (HSP70)
LSQTPWYLAIDFGTTRTAAAVAVGDGEPELVRFEGRPDPGRVLGPRQAGHEDWMPSAVFAQSEGDYRTGIEAIAALGGERPERVILTPKLRIAEGRDTQDIGFATVPTYKVAAEVLKTAHQTARRQVGASENGIGRRPEAVVLTCPVGWTADAKSDLRAAAGHAGIEPTAKLISEPEAAARHFQAELADGEVIAIYDLGGGTCDIAVVRREGDGFRTLAKEYDDLVGGELFDDLLYYRHVLQALGSVDGQARERLELVYHDPTARHLKERRRWLSCERQLRRNVSEAKERLSEAARAGVRVPPPVELDVAVSRADLENQIRRDVDRTVELLRKCIDRALGGSDELKAVYLIGGSSQIPLIRERARRRLGEIKIQCFKGARAKAPVALGGVMAVAPAAGRADRMRGEPPVWTWSGPTTTPSERLLERLKEVREKGSPAGGPPTSGPQPKPYLANLFLPPQGYRKKQPSRPEPTLRVRYARFATFQIGSKVTDIAFSPDGGRIAVASQCGSIEVWEVEAKGRRWRSARVGEERPFAKTWPLGLAWFGDEIVSANDDATVEVWGAGDGSSRGFLSGYIPFAIDLDFEATAVAASPIARAAAAGTARGKITLWSQDREKEWTVRPHDGWVWAVAFSPDGSRLATGGTDGLATIRARSNGDAIHTCRHTAGDSVYSVAFSPDGRLLGSASGNVLDLWSAETAAHRREISGHEGQVQSVAFRRDGHLLASGSADKTVRLWDPETGQQVSSFLEARAVSAVAFSPNGHFLASACGEDVVLRKAQWP